MSKLLLLLPLLMLTACTNSASTLDNLTTTQSVSSPVTSQRLAHRHFVLTQVDRVSIAQGNRMYPGIDFYENSQLGATFCNELQGTYRIDGQQIFSDLHPRNQQACAKPEWEKWDTLFTQMLQQGATISWYKQTLYLSDGVHTMQFTLKDWVY